MPFQPFEREADRSEYRRHLPHWAQPGCTYFVTFRLGDSLPVVTLDRWRAERTTWLRAHGLQDPAEVVQLPEPERREFHRHFNRRLQEYLDAGEGSCLLRDPRFSSIVASALLFFDTKRCALGDFVVMPNHVHLLVTPFPGWKLTDLLRGWKRFSASEINKLREAQGSLWMDENFDHAVRNREQLDYFRRYIVENPRKARLREGEYALGCGSDAGQ